MKTKPTSKPWTKWLLAGILALAITPATAMAEGTTPAPKTTPKVKTPSLFAKPKEDKPKPKKTPAKDKSPWRFDMPGTSDWKIVHLGKEGDLSWTTAVRRTAAGQETEEDLEEVHGSQTAMKTFVENWKKELQEKGGQITKEEPLTDGVLLRYTWELHDGVWKICTSERGTTILIYRAGGDIRGNMVDLWESAIKNATLKKDQ
jgi:hypothetical protein